MIDINIYIGWLKIKKIVVIKVINFISENSIIIKVHKFWIFKEINLFWNYKSIIKFGLQNHYFFLNYYN